MNNLQRAKEDRLQDEREWILNAANARNIKISINDADYIAQHYISKEDKAVTSTYLQAERDTKEKQSKRYITLMQKALGDIELPEKVWSRIAKVNQLILDK